MAEVNNVIENLCVFSSWLDENSNNPKLVNTSGCKNFTGPLEGSARFYNPTSGHDEHHASPHQEPV